jgi:hypothetical protein
VRSLAHLLPIPRRGFSRFYYMTTCSFLCPVSLGGINLKLPTRAARHQQTRSVSPGDSSTPGVPGGSVHSLPEFLATSPPTPHIDLKFVKKKTIVQSCRPTVPASPSSTQRKISSCHGSYEGPQTIPIVPADKIYPTTCNSTGSVGLLTGSNSPRTESEVGAGSKTAHIKHEEVIIIDDDTVDTRISDAAVPKIASISDAGGLPLIKSPSVARAPQRSFSSSFTAHMCSLHDESKPKVTALVKIERTANSPPGAHPQVSSPGSCNPQAAETIATSRSHSPILLRDHSLLPEIEVPAKLFRRAREALDVAILLAQTEDLPHCIDGLEALISDMDSSLCGDIYNKSGASSAFDDTAAD